MCPPEARRRLPSCCGSEDGDLHIGVDPAPGGATAEVWHCNACGVMTVVRVLLIGDSGA